MPCGSHFLILYFLLNRLLAFYFLGVYLLFFAVALSLSSCFVKAAALLRSLLLYILIRVSKCIR